MKIAAAAPIILASYIVLPFMARGLNAITLGEAAAFHMGVPVQRLKNIAIVTVAAATGASVAVSGGIGFVGIVVPHVLRMVIGPDHRYLLPASALLGGSLLIFADVLARTIVAPAELPIGIITAAVGGPFFLWILLRQRSRLAL
jgi:iron complex transport system permease protein